MAQIQCERGYLDEAADLLMRGRAALASFPSPLLDFNYGLVKCEVARRLGRRSEFLATLAATFAIGRAQGYGNEIHAYTVFLPRLVPYALEHDIEVDYCRGLIRKRHYQPPARSVPNWPWPVQVRSLGRFEVRVDDEPLQVHRKSQRRPLSLLKAILVSRSGTEITVLMDYFWPDLDGDAARNALDLAVFRLRRLLKHKDAVVLKQGRLMLNRNTVWVDAFALTTLSDATDTDEPPAELALSAHALSGIVFGRRVGALDICRAASGCGADSYAASANWATCSRPRTAMNHSQTSINAFWSSSLWQSQSIEA